ncbi:efflux RND transporter periplasmic adaptor subunit [Olivibacter sitiensis]|uniref:efflux RND transporter periplasmic adaptor subunit n=1 Tax=Olivibacter sitiensis TaxID=376470 RepID=UPI0004852397|nr:efflux RND transporter periplasmic adaptor subunit [Olivibacter sitiensis]
MEQLRFYFTKTCALCIATLSLVSCGSEEEKTEAKTVAVQIQTIAYDARAHQQEYIGTVESENTLDVSFLTMGNVERMYAHEGQKVSKGQLLASLNMISLKSAHELALVTLRQAEDAYKRMSTMYENKSLPEIQYIDYKTKLEQARAAESIARKNLQDGQLYAPQSGVIGRRYVESGASVMPGTPVYQIMDINSVKIKVPVPENEVSSIRIGSVCNVSISALGNQTFSGKIIEKGVAANPISHTYDIKVQIANPSGQIMPGMVCKAYLNNTLSSDEGSIIIPLKAIQIDHSGKRFVWLKGKDNKAVYKEVTLGKLEGNGVIIENGLREGDELITEGYQNISEGVLLTAKNTTK